MIVKCLEQNNLYILCRLSIILYLFRLEELLILPSYVSLFFSNMTLVPQNEILEFIKDVSYLSLIVVL